MRALISGRTKFAILLYDNGQMLKLRIDTENYNRKVSSFELNYILSNCNDFRLIENTNLAKVKDFLQKACEAEDALFIILNILDNNTSMITRSNVAIYLNEIILKEHVLQHLSNVLYARPLPQNHTYDFTGLVNNTCAALMTFIGNLSRLQSVISSVRKAWDEISIEYFGSRNEYRSAQKDLVYTGHFRYKVSKVSELYELHDIYKDFNHIHPTPANINYDHLLNKWDTNITALLPLDSNIKDVILANIRTTNGSNDFVNSKFKLTKHFFSLHPRPQYEFEDTKTEEKILISHKEATEDE